ncbi:5500_t:CDS:2, partial [Dentiscutata heterogama]
DTDVHFVTANKMFKFKYNKPGLVESDISFDYEFENSSVASSFYKENDNINTDELPFQESIDEASQESIDEISQEKVVNTKNNTKTWVNAINKYFADTNLTGDITQIKDQYELESILINFFVALKKKDGQPYAPTSIHNCYYTIARHLQSYSCLNPRPNIYDKNVFARLYSTVDSKIKLTQDNNPCQTKKSDALSDDDIVKILNHEELLKNTPTAITYQVYFWLCLLCGLRGGDAHRLEFNHVKSAHDKVIQVTIPQEKNHAGGLKNLTNASRSCEIPPDMNGKFIPVADILYYIYRRGQNFKSKEFFLKIAPNKDFIRGIWFHDATLGQHSHEKMIHEICRITGIDTNLKKITNHSLRRTSIQILTQLNVATDCIMAFSGHRSLGGVASYQSFTREILHNT